MVKVQRSHGVTGTLSFRGEDYRIENGVIDVADVSVAREMVAARQTITWRDGQPDDADECPYHE